MKIHLPNSAFLGNIDPFFQSFVPEDKQVLTITSNQKWISVHPVVLCMVAALGINLNPGKIIFVNLEATSVHYLERIGLFRMLRVDSKIKINEHESAGRFIPLTQIKSSAELTNFITDMIPLLHIDKKQGDSIKYVISELVRNVLEHSKSKDGAIVCAQYYKKSNIIRIGIADSGIGIRSAIMQAHKVSNDIDALKLALTPGITGTTPREGGTEYNAGAGLFFIKSIAKTNKDFFLIYSGSASYKLLKKHKNFKLYADPFQDKHSKKSDLPYWQGTVVGIDITLNQTQTFSELLDLIHDIYIKTIRDRKKEKYRSPRFT